MVQSEIQDEFIRIIYNEIPLRLIHVPTMRLMDRSQVRRRLQPKIEKLKDGERMEDLVRYAILSHRWLEKGEVPFKDFPGEKERGCKKLEKFCKVVDSYGVEFAWVDTCCIDKSSSAELDESIRSMFRWYRNAYICIIHLAESVALEDIHDDEWFKRGWTLQELLAPRRRDFRGAKWAPLTSGRDEKADEDEIMSYIRDITGIPDKALTNFTPGPGEISEGSQGFSKRMSWAAGRKTSRAEDRAYSLMGIFNVSIPIAYGEGGDRAFFRLMEAILQISNDRDILNWAGRPASTGHPTKMIPSSPDCYLNGQPSISTTLDDPMQLTNMGLAMRLLFRKVKYESAIESTRTVDMQFACSLCEGGTVRVTINHDVWNDGPYEDFALGIWNVTRARNLPDTFHACLLVKKIKYDRWEKLPTEKPIHFEHRFDSSLFRKGDIWERIFL